jgi:outer membrane protein W
MLVKGAKEAKVKKLLIIVALLVFGAFSVANAQDLQGMFSISPFGGLGMPMGDMGDDEGEDAMNRAMGFKFGLEADYFFTPNIGAGVEFMYAIFGNDYEDEYADEYGDDKLNTMMIGVHGKYVMMPESMFRPYGVVGFGMVMNKVKDVYDWETEEEGELKLDSKFYLRGGIGGMYWVSEMISIFGEVGLDYMMTDGSGLEFEGTEIPDAEVTANYMFIDFKVGANIWFGGTE